MRLRSEQGPDLVEKAAETPSRGKGFEPVHGTVPLFNTAMVLLQVIIQVAVRPVHHPLPENVPNRARINIMPIGHNPVRRDPRHGPRRAEERLGRGEISGVAESYSDQVPIPVNGPIEVLPPTLDPLCSAIIVSRRRKRVGVQPTRTELGAKQHWTRDVRAGIIARDNNPYLRGTPWL